MLYRAFVAFIWSFWLVMVVLLVRSEYFPERASVYRLPIAYVGEQVFHSDTGSELDLEYKGTLVGKVTLEPAPPRRRILKGKVDLDWPVLGRPIEGSTEFGFLFNRKLDVEDFTVHGEFPGFTWRVHGDRKSDQVETEFTMNGPPQKRSYSWRSLEQQGPSELTKDLNPEAAQAAPLAMLGIGKAHSLRWYGASTRLEHNGRKIEALLIETEGDPDYWVKIWITPTGEILRMRTSPLLGLSAENRSLLEPAEDTAKP